jgi:hypothetical protein
VAIGQIVGRPYMAVRYQMTSSAVINSPVENQAFRERIRKIWGSDDPVRMLFDSLWLDYRTTGITQEKDDLYWSLGSRYQREATLRLLYYFPRESAPIIEARLNKLNVAKTHEPSVEFRRQGVANGGVYANEFVHAASWCKEPVVRDAVRGIFTRTTDAHVFLATIEAFNATDSVLIAKRADELINGLTGEEKKAGVQTEVLEMLAARTGEVSANTFLRLIGKAGPNELGSIASSLQQAKGDWPITLLKPLLDDRRQTDELFYLRDSQKVPVRVCDGAAKALCVLLKDDKLQFPKDPDRTALDQYIAKVKMKLKASVSK